MREDVSQIMLVSTNATEYVASTKPKRRHYNFDATPKSYYTDLSHSLCLVFLQLLKFNHPTRALNRKKGQVQSKSCSLVSLSKRLA